MTLRFRTAALVMGTALVFAGSANAADITFKLAHGASDKHPFHKLAELYKASVEKKTGGKVEVQLFPNRQLGDDIDVLNAELEAWTHATNADERQVDWQFTSSDARIKHRHLYPVL